MNDLILYSVALDALAECKFTDEVKDWIDRAAATAAYAKMAGDKTLEVDAAEIRIRAERRLGEMLIEQKATGGLAVGRPKNNGSPEEPFIRLAEVGISKKLSARSQKIAAVPKAEFESEVAGWRGRVSAEGERVTARLEASGRKHVEAATGEEGAGSEEDDGQAEMIDRDYEAALAVFEADDKLKEAWARLEAARVKYAQLDGLYRGQSTALAEMTRTAARWKRKFEALEKAAKP